MSDVDKGLDRTIVNESTLSEVDGAKGDLIYRGFSIHDLVERCQFEDVVYLLFYDQFPSKQEAQHFRQDLAQRRALPDEWSNHIRLIAGSEKQPMAAIRTAFSLASAFDRHQHRARDMEADRERAFDLVAQGASLVAAYQRSRHNHTAIPPDPNLSLAADFLRMMTGQEAGPYAVQTFNMCLILHAEHSFNASTFSARVTASTEADLYSALTSAVGTLSGPLHGGANTAVMAVLKEIGHPDQVEAWLDQKLARKERVPGFGHRVYKTIDPRAIHLKKLSQRLCQETGQEQLYDLSAKLEQLMQEKKGLKANVDFYSASSYHCMGIPGDLFTPIFALSRVAGWCAHVLEQKADNRLIRPKCRYTGKRNQAIPQGWD